MEYLAFGIVGAATIALGVYGSDSERKIAGAAAISAIAALLLLFLSPKFYEGPLFLAFILITIANARHVGATRFISWFLLASAYFAGWWVGAATLQIGYEFETFGHITKAYDYCTFALAPYAIGILYIGLILFAGLGALVSRAFFPADRIPTAFVVGVGVLIAIAGAFTGYSSWHDWQVQQPCL